MSILVTGASGLLGSEILALSNDALGLSSKDCNLLNDDFRDFLDSKVDVVIHCAAKVGGVKANSDFVSDFFEENMRINSNVMRACKERNIKLVSVLSTCIYPDKDYVTYPLTENQLHNGPPHRSNFGYAYAKRMIDIQSRAYREQYCSNFITAIPNNLYGPNDNYHLENGHVVPSLIRKFYEAKIQNSPTVTLWGTGMPVREFTYSKDAARIILWLANSYNSENPVNIGNSESISIRSLSSMISNFLEYNGRIIFDETKPDGQFKKPSSNEYLRSLGYDKEYTRLEVGLSETVEEFIKRYPNVRGI